MRVDLLGLQVRAEGGHLDALAVDEEAGRAVVAQARDAAVGDPAAQLLVVAHELVEVRRRRSRGCSPSASRGSAGRRCPSRRGRRSSRSSPPARRRARPGSSVGASRSEAARRKATSRSTWRLLTTLRYAGMWIACASISAWYAGRARFFAGAPSRMYSRRLLIVVRVHHHRAFAKRRHLAALAARVGHAAAAAGAVTVEAAELRWR